MIEMVLPNGEHVKVSRILLLDLRMLTKTDALTSFATVWPNGMGI
jgi:hypothetical protein